MSAFLKNRVGLSFKSILLLGILLAVGGCNSCRAEVLRYHTLVVDGQGEIIPWFTPTTNAFDNYLVKCWSWALAAPNDTNGLPISFLYCAWNPGNPATADTSWENDVGEKIPNWVESARLYYQYTGDMAPLNYVKRLVDYSLEHGQTPTNHAWPAFPVGTANAGDTEFRGFTGVWALWDCHVDLAAHIGFSMCRMYQMYGDTKYLDKAIHVADVLASHIVPGTATSSPWPYVINSQNGAKKSVYAASWTGALRLFDFLIDGNQGSVSNYTSARSTLKNWLLTYPMQNGNWVDGHSDVKIDGTGNWSTTCASDMCLYLSDHPSWDPNFLTDVPKLLKWAEDNFVNVSTPDGLSGQYHGAYVPAEQIAYMYRMGYQTARIGAQYGQWYAVSGDPTYKDRAYRCFSYNTYMMQNNGQSSDGPTATVSYWWSDCYGEATRMYYYGLGAVPEWAPADQNHLLSSSSVVTSVSYASNAITYTTFDNGSEETLRVAFTPAAVSVNSVWLPKRADLTQPGWVLTASNGVLRIRHDTGTKVEIIAGADGSQRPVITNTSLPDGIMYVAYSATLFARGGTPPYNWALAGGALPPGLTLRPNTGTIDGVPTTAGSYDLTAQVSDSGTPVRTGSMPLTLRILAFGAIIGAIGNTNEGTSSDYLWDSRSWINASRFQAISNTVVSTVYAKVQPVAGHYNCAIYADAGGSPSALLRGAAEVSNPGDGWQAFRLTSSFTATNGFYYWLAIWSDDANARVYYSDTSGTLQSGQYDYGAWPDPIATTGSGNFDYCIFGSTQSPSPPVIGLQPERQVVNLGSNATFTVSAAGDVPLFYQWYYNSTNALDGSTNSLFLLAGVGDTDAGWYSVLVSNAAGMVLSGNAQLIVNHLPVPASPTLPRYSGSGFRAPESVFVGTDQDGDNLFISSVLPLSVRGAAVSVGEGWVTYAPPADLTNDDTFDYTIADGRGGFGVGTARVLVLTNRGPTLKAVWESGDAAALRIVGNGIPYRSYTFEFEEGMGAGWQPIGTVMSDALGVFTHVESLSPGVSSRFYRVTTY